MIWWWYYWWLPWLMMARPRREYPAEILDGGCRLYRMEDARRK